MIWLVLGLALLGVLLSAFFSGTETGFYRVSRMRLVLDALGGDPIARGLFWLSNHSSFFVATALLGNNVANYLVSLATVLAAQTLFSPQNHAGELILSLVLSPVLFIYGELLPKNLFLHAPNRLLRKAGPAFFVFAAMFFPLSALLWGLTRLLARFVSQSDEPIRLALARRELQRMLEEGHEAGILNPAQRGLARGIFGLAGQPVRDFIMPLAAAPRARRDMAKDEVLRLARRYQLSAVCVEEPGVERSLIGYVQVVQLRLAPSNELQPLRPLLEIRESDSHLDALIRMQTAKEPLAKVVDAAGRTLGVLTIERLREPLFRRGPVKPTIAAPTRGG